MNMPRKSMDVLSDGPKIPPKSENHGVAPAQDVASHGGISIPQQHSAAYDGSVPQAIPAHGISQAQGFSPLGMPATSNQLAASIDRLGTAMNRVVESVERNNRLMRQLLVQDVQHTHILVNASRENTARLDESNRLVRRVVDEMSAFREGTEADLPLFE
ncbi:hypothetical protein IL306_000398 [Fusarium sp. DS 682]|nr:hypothetical protein IL306_000398 [Fusarium sp. DS 682]